MRFLLVGLFLSLSAADNRKPTEPMDIPLKQKRLFYLQKMHEQKTITADDLKKSSQIIAEANKKYIYTNPEFTSNDDEKDK